MLEGRQIMQYFLLTLHLHVHSIIDTWKKQLMNQAVTNQLPVSQRNAQKQLIEQNTQDIRLTKHHWWLVGSAYSSHSTSELCSKRQTKSPMLVAPASRLFSTSSFTAVANVNTTWPEQIRWTVEASIAWMLPDTLLLSSSSMYNVFVYLDTHMNIC